MMVVDLQCSMVVVAISGNNVRSSGDHLDDRHWRMAQQSLAILTMKMTVGDDGGVGDSG